MTFNSEMCAALIAGTLGYLLEFDEDSILFAIVCTMVTFEGIIVLHRHLFKE